MWYLLVAAANDCVEVVCGSNCPFHIPDWRLRSSLSDDAWYRSRRLGKKIWYLLVAAAHDRVEVVDAVDEEACLVLELLLLLVRLPMV